MPVGLQRRGDARRRARQSSALETCGARSCPRRETRARPPRHPRVSRASRFSAKLRRASGNHFAPGILSASTSVRSPRSPMTPAVIPDRPPECLVLVVRPAPQRRRSRESRGPASRATRARERRDVRRARCARALAARGDWWSSSAVLRSCARRAMRLLRLGRLAARAAAPAPTPAPAPDVRSRDRSRRSSSRALGVLPSVHQDLVEAAHARAAGLTQIHPHLDVARIDERREKRAARVDDHGTRRRAAVRTAFRDEPIASIRCAPAPCSGNKAMLLTWPSMSMSPQRIDWRDVCTRRRGRCVIVTRLPGPR